MSAQQVNDLIAEAARKAILETDAEPEPGLTKDVEWPVQATLGRGLEGAISNSTRIGYVNGAKGWLVYRGSNCFDLAQYSTFEETCYLLLYGKLPTSSELAGFNDKLLAYRNVPQTVIDVLKTIPTAKSHPMSVLATAVSVLGNLDSDAQDTSVAAETEIAIKLIAQMATVAAAIARLRKGLAPVNPSPELGHAGSFIR